MAPRVTAKTPKGTRDILPEAMAVREKAFSLIKKTFMNHGAVQIDTPVFERREVLQNQYGEDSKLIYNLADDMTSDTGEKLSLRYDLSVPFARYIATNNIQNIKRFHIAKVYRRDRPAIERGRFREFFQCDFDIAGQNGIVADAEVVSVMLELFDNLAKQSVYHEEIMGSYKIKISHRVILNAMMSVCGVPDEKLRTICSAIDKLDKEPWEAVRSEMVNEKGLSMEVADAIEPFVRLSGPAEEVLSELRRNTALLERCENALNDMERLFKLVSCMRDDAKQRLVFDLSLARGLDYYTGVIFEAVLVGKNVGSIGAGGRYDNLVGMFRKNSIPCVGCSLGVERILTFMVDAAKKEAKANRRDLRAAKTEVMVASIGKGTMEWRVSLSGELWKEGLATEFCFNENWNLGKQVTAAVTAGIPVLVIVGEDEISEGVVKVKNLVMEEERVVRRGVVAEAVREELGRVDDGNNRCAS